MSPRERHHRRLGYGLIPPRCLANGLEVSKWIAGPGPELAFASVAATPYRPFYQNIDKVRGVSRAPEARAGFESGLAQPDRHFNQSVYVDVTEAVALAQVDQAVDQIDAGSGVRLWPAPSKPGRPRRQSPFAPAGSGEPGA